MSGMGRWFISFCNLLLGMLYASEKASGLLFWDEEARGVGLEKGIWTVSMHVRSDRVSDRIFCSHVGLGGLLACHVR
jgi:hypothetical protein